MHTASPVGGNPKNHQEMIRPAVAGVKNVMIAASKHKIKRVVITSSIAAVICQPAETDTHRYSEEDWTDMGAADYSAYFKSKTLAERAAWDFYKEAGEGAHIPEIATINPGWVLGEVIGCGV